MHDLERDNPDISIPNAAFKRVFDLSDGYRWRLDSEPFAKDVIAQSKAPELLRAFRHALYGNRERSDTGVSVLDPPAVPAA